MKDVQGFIKYKRQLPDLEPTEQRLSHWKEFYKEADSVHLHQQSARCMDCGVPFCHNACPLGNKIPDFNRAVANNEWRLAYDILIETNNFPEFTGRICPAPCESSCVLSINKDAVAIEYIEKSVIEKAYLEGWVQPKANIKRNGKSIAIVGSGPAGLACADQLNSLGYKIDLFEKDDKIGGLLRYGIPDFKLEKSIIDRRLEIMKSSGINMYTSVNVGYDILGQDLLETYDAVVLAGGANVARDLPIKGRNLKGVHFAMDYLVQNNRRVAGCNDESLKIDVFNKDIVVIGGGDTGADCVGTSNRLGAKSVTQIELLSKPPAIRKANDLWPNWPMILRTSTSHEEGCEREWAILTKKFISNDGSQLSGLEVVDIEWQMGDFGKSHLVEIEGSRRVVPCEVAILAIGFSHTQKEGLIDQLGVELDRSGNVKSKKNRTNITNVYAAGDIRKGQSLVVNAIAEGRKAALTIHHDINNVNKSRSLPLLSV